MLSGSDCRVNELVKIGGGRNGEEKSIPRASHLVEDLLLVVRHI